MKNLSKTLRNLSIGLAAVGFLVIAGHYSEVSAQRDPFVKPGYMKPKPVSTGSGVGKTSKPGMSVPVNYGAPPIEARIEYYKRQREAAAASGSPLPKVTSVLTLSEMTVSGIFKTPRGYAAMVEATPIKLSYTIYPGEKFFDGQLVAVEENRLVFRKVTKTGPNKFVASVENKPLQNYSMRAQIEGTAPAQAGSDKPAQTAEAAPAAGSTTPTAPPVSMMSPLDEMNNQPADTNKTKKEAKKPVKVAKNSKK
ncbi:MAG: hypothetical protein KA746_11590 [Pyrinomonadaceae bacterium]|nr:hypothetical protein [Pyrinomonadaceae bacterium]MBP6212303.1 hypothetical protein [Pyrinomonadaceae bacterium]